MQKTYRIFSALECLRWPIVLQRRAGNRQGWGRATQLYAASVVKSVVSRQTVLLRKGPPWKYNRKTLRKERIGVIEWIVPPSPIGLQNLTLDDQAVLPCIMPESGRCYAYCVVYPCICDVYGCGPWPVNIE
jgi:hypothetical protein